MGFLERYFGGHLTLQLWGGRRLVIFGFNARHVAINFRTRRHGWFCFHPPMYCFGQWWPWYFYISLNATPWATTFAAGPGISHKDKSRARRRRALLKQRHQEKEKEARGEEQG